MKISVISSIISAYDMQPYPIEVGKSIFNGALLCEIRLMSFFEDSDCYKGYDIEGNELFRYWAKSVNVHYVNIDK